MAAAMLDQDFEDLALVLVHNEAVRQRNRKATLPYVVRRHENGAFHSLVQELAEQDPKYLHKFIRMNGDTFDELLHIVGPSISKLSTNFKESIAPEERLAVSLRFLAEGGPYNAMGFFPLLFRIQVATLAYLIPETYETIYNALKDRYLKVPNTEEQWREIQNKFHHKWNFPQCLGALDGKYVRIQCPRNGGSLYYNYCGFHSIALFALVDATYRFLYYEVGAQGRVGDATIWNASNLKRDLELENGRLNTPPALATQQTNTPIPSFIVADSAFALSPKLVKPYPERGTDHEKKVFNYRLSRARRIVENAFGMSVWSVPVCHEGGTREDQKDCSCHTCAAQFPARCERPAVLWPW